ncbi:MAG: hypothetical protein NUV65_03635 [Candidatus Roizmanbacteria bacterium]|nr:hypothetical protein [Candidatus Roizmanbacteria bacterium]
MQIMYSQRSIYWPAYTWKVQTSYASSIKGKLSNEFKISEADFEKIYFDIFDKINASFYHLERLKENEEIAIKIGTELEKVHMPGTEGMVGIVASPYEPIGYEYESFLVTSKSTLDFIAILIAKGFGRAEDNIISLLNEVQSANYTLGSLEEKVCKLLQNNKFSALFLEYRNIDKDQKSKRNYATHKGSLPIGTINIPINNPKGVLLRSKALNPNSPIQHSNILNSQNLVEYCQDQFYQICDLLIETLSLITCSLIKSGPKSSVYQQSRSS